MANFYQVFDRKTPRHHWRAVGSTSNETHFQAILHMQTETVRTWDPWPKGQVGYLTAEDFEEIRDQHQLPANAPMTVHFDKSA